MLADERGKILAGQERSGGVNEFFAMGRVPAIESAIGLVAGCSIQLVVVVQSLVQLKQLYGDAWEAFLGQAGAVILVGSPADDFTARTTSPTTRGELTTRQPTAECNINPGRRGWTWGDIFTAPISELPQDLRNIRRGEGYIWLAGLNDPLPAMFPPYYDDPLRPELKRRRARTNPYYRG